MSILDASNIQGTVAVFFVNMIVLTALLPIPKIPGRLTHLGNLILFWITWTAHH